MFSILFTHILDKNHQLWGLMWLVGLVGWTGQVCVWLGRSHTWIGFLLGAWWIELLPVVIHTSPGKFWQPRNCFELGISHRIDTVSSLIRRHYWLLCKHICIRLWGFQYKSLWCKLSSRVYWVWIWCCLQYIWLQWVLLLVWLLFRCTWSDLHL